MAYFSKQQILIMANLKNTRKYLPFCFVIIFITSVILFSCSALKDREIPPEEETVQETEQPTGTAPSAADSGTDGNSEYAVLSKTKEVYGTLESHTIDSDKIKQTDIGGLKELDFTDCSIVILDYWGAKIYEYMTEDVTAEFLSRLTEAEISSEEYEGDLLVYDGGGAFAYRFAITLNTGEIVYIGSARHDNMNMILLNGYHGYQCDQDTFEYLEKCYEEACDRFREKVSEW